MNLERVSSRLESARSHPDLALAQSDQIAVVEQQIVLEQTRVGWETKPGQLAKKKAEKERPEAAGLAKRGQQLGGSGPRRPIVPRRMPAPIRIPQPPNTRMVPAIMPKPAASPHEPPTAKVPRRMAAPISLPTSPPIRIVPSVIPRLLPR